MYLNPKTAETDSCIVTCSTSRNSCFMTFAINYYLCLMQNQEAAHEKHYSLRNLVPHQTHG